MDRRDEIEYTFTNQKEEIMSNRIKSQLSNRKKRLHLVVGFMVASVHLAVSYAMALEGVYLNRIHSDNVFLFLTAPSLLLIIIIESLFSPFPSIFPETALALWAIMFLFIEPSSFLYGITGGFLASETKKRQWMGIFLLGLLLISGCYVLWLLPRMD